MMNRKTAVSLTLIGLLAANIAFAVPGFSTDAPQRGVETCLAEVGNNADLSNGTSVFFHDVKTEDRRISGHTMRIRTYVYGIDGETIIREYATSCAINGQDQIKRFRIRQKGA